MQLIIKVVHDVSINYSCYNDHKPSTTGDGLYWYLVAIQRLSLSNIFVCLNVGSQGISILPHGSIVLRLLPFNSCNRTSMRNK